MMENRHFQLWIAFPAVVFGFTLVLMSCTDQTKRPDGIPEPPVSKPGVITFKAEPPEIAEGGSATLTWETVNATSVTISSLARVPLSGSETVRPGRSTTYELTAANAAGETTKTVRVRVTFPLKLPSGEAGDKLHEKGKVELPVSERRVKEEQAEVLTEKGRISVVTLKWGAMRGAVSYTVEIDCFSCCQANRWCADVGREYKVIRSIKSTEHKLEFDKTQRGRWRVWSVDKNGVQGKKSKWRDIR